jgi:hypothetical protein
VHQCDRDFDGLPQWLTRSTGPAQRTAQRRPGVRPLRSATHPLVHAGNSSSNGRLPLGAASELFTHWRDLTNAERMNYWLDVLADITYSRQPSYSD